MTLQMLQHPGSETCNRMAQRCQSTLFNGRDGSLGAGPAIALFGLTLVIAVVYGFQYRVLPDRKVAYFAAGSLPFATLLAISTWYAVQSRLPRVPSARVQGRVGFILMSISLVSTMYFWSAGLRPVSWSVCALFILGVAFVSHIKWGARGSTVVFSSFALLFFALLAWRTPHTDGANMLQIIEAASRELLVGTNPQHAFPAIAGDAPFSYLPALWLPYAFFVWVDADPRILNFLAFVGLILLFEKGFPRSKRVTPETLAITFYPLLFSSTIAAMMVYGHVWPFWIYLCACVLLMLHKRYYMASVLFGLAVAARQPALFLLGPVIVFVFRVTGVQRTLQYAFVAIGAYSLFVLPFVVWTGPTYLETAYLKLADTIKGTNQDPMLGAQAAFDWLGASPPLTYVQLFLLGAATVSLLLRRHIEVERFLLVSGAAYAWLVFTAFYSVRYEYFPGFLLTSVGLSALFAERQGPCDLIPDLDRDGVRVHR